MKAGLFVTVFISGDVEVEIGNTRDKPRSNGMFAFALREDSPFSGSGQADVMRAVGVTMYRDDLYERGLMDWFEALFDKEEKMRFVQVAADTRSLQQAEAILSYDPNDPLDVLRIEAAAQDIFLHGIALLMSQTEPSQKNRIMHMIDVVEADLGRPWTASEMARLSGLSTRSLSKHFKQAMGATPFGWLRQRRLLRGRDMVVEGSDAISNIADQLGFSSPAHFSTAYRAMFGEAPKETRRRT